MGFRAPHTAVVRGKSCLNDLTGVVKDTVGVSLWTKTKAVVTRGILRRVNRKCNATRPLVANEDLKPVPSLNSKLECLRSNAPLLLAQFIFLAENVMDHRHPRWADHGIKGFVIPTKSFVRIGVTKILCYNNKMFSSINKRLVAAANFFVAAANFLVAATKNLFVVHNFVAVTKPFFFRDHFFGARTPDFRISGLISGISRISGRISGISGILRM